jgi:hypothetical protein
VRQTDVNNRDQCSRDEPRAQPRHFLRFTRENFSTFGGTESPKPAAAALRGARKRSAAPAPLREMATAVPTHVQVLCMNAGTGWWNGIQLCEKKEKKDNIAAPCGGMSRFPVCLCGERPWTTLQVHARSQPADGDARSRWRCAARRTATSSGIAAGLAPRVHCQLHDHRRGFPRAWRVVAHGASGTEPRRIS